MMIGLNKLNLNLNLKVIDCIVLNAEYMVS